MSEEMFSGTAEKLLRIFFQWILIFQSYALKDRAKDLVMLRIQFLEKKDLH